MEDKETQQCAEDYTRNGQGAVGRIGAASPAWRWVGRGRLEKTFQRRGDQVRRRGSKEKEGECFR